jgi:hypothetical protein
MIAASAMKLMKSPSVTMTALISGPCSTGRMMIRSTSPPMTKPDARATRSASQNEYPAWITCSAR